MIPLTYPDASPLRSLPSAYSAAIATIIRAKSGVRCRSVLTIAPGLLTFLVFLGPDAMAQGFVFSNASFSTGLRPSWVMTGDFNKDGIADIAAVNQCGSDPTCLTAGSVSILLGNPDGTFQAAVDYATGSGSLPRFGMLGDFNGDGITDIAVANLGANTISILLGKGDGTFQPHVDYAVGSSPLSIAAGDFNGDGKTDLAVANSGSNSISILLGNGDGTFQTHVDFATSFAPQSVATADFNGDGRLDLVVADLNVSVLLGKGDGTFSAPMEFPGNGASFVAAGDFNGDGKADVVAVGSFADTVAVYLSNGDGTFQTPVAYEVGGGPESLIAIDLNGDGHLDLAVAAGVGGGGPNVAGTLSILLNKGDGTFEAHRDFGGMTAVSVAAADFNGDGHLDVAIPNRDFNVVNILLGDGKGAFGSVLDIGTQAVPPTQVVVGDFNGDGNVDLGLAMQASGIVGVALGNGDGTFQAPIFDNAPGGGLSIATGDFNGDGKLDVAAFVGSELNNMQILLGNGDGTFKPRLSFAVSNNPGQVLAADLNGDGKLDLVVVGFGCNVLLGNGDGTFSPGAAFASNQITGALLADLNGDGKLDLAVVSASPSAITIFLGNGDGTFQAGVEYGTGGASVGILAADFNGDGKPDLAVANTATNTVSVLLGNGDGTFQPHTDYPVIQSPRSLTAADFDGDGKTDLAVVGNGFSYLLGKGDGTFQTHVDYLTSISVTSAISADFNKDGRSDLAVANTFASSLSVVLNLPTLTLRPAQLSFPSQLVGTTGQPETITLYNPGIEPLSIQSVATSSDFSQTNNCVGSVGNGKNCALNVTFKPTASGSRNGTLTISDNAQGSPQAIPLSGMGTDFSLVAATGANCPSGGNCTTSATVTDGQTATYNLQVSSLNGFTGTVALGCASAPALAVCTVAPASAVVNGTSATAFTVTVTTTAPSMTTPLDVPREWPPINPEYIEIAWLLALLLFALRRLSGTKALGRKLGLACALAVISMLLITAWGCSGGGSHNLGTPKGTSTLTITGTSQGVGRTLDLKLTVN